MDQAHVDLFRGAIEKQRAEDEEYERLKAEGAARRKWVSEAKKALQHLEKLKAPVPHSLLAYISVERLIDDMERHATRPIDRVRTYAVEKVCEQLHNENLKWVGIARIRRAALGLPPASIKALKSEGECLRKSLQRAKQRTKHEREERHKKSAVLPSERLPNLTVAVSWNSAIVHD